MPDFGRVSIIDASAFDAGTAYVAVKKPLLDDFAPYIFRTHDYGETWTKIVTGIRAQRLRARRARGSDAQRPALRRHAARRLHLVRRRRHWQSLSLNLPDTQISRLWSSRRTTSRSRRTGAAFYILDHIGPLRAVPAPGALARRRVSLQAGRRDSFGAAARRSVPAASSRRSRIKIEIVDPKGTVVQTFGGVRRPAARRQARRRGGGRGRRRRVAADGGGGGGGRAAAPMARRAQQRDVEPALPGRDVVPRHDPLGRRRRRGPVAAPGTYRCA